MDDSLSVMRSATEVSGIKRHADTLRHHTPPGQAGGRRQLQTLPLGEAARRLGRVLRTLLPSVEKQEPRDRGVGRLGAFSQAPDR